MPGDKRICAECVSDDYLKSVINQSQGTNQTCDYCGMLAPTIDMQSLADICDEVIENFYEVSSLTQAVIHFGRTPDGYPVHDVLEDLIAPPTDALNDLVEILRETWFDWSSHEYKYGDEDPWFVEKSNLKEPLSSAWEKMEQSLRHEARHFNPSAVALLEQIFGSILDDRTDQGSSVIVDLGNGSEFDTLFRARVFQTSAPLEEAFEHPERHFGPPPPGVGTAGRMNAKGIPVFYGATKEFIAVSEVRPPVGSLVVVAQFHVIRPLRVLDLRKLGTIRLQPSASLFDPETVKEATRRDFLRELTMKLVMPVVPELEDHSYVVTQAIADFLATHPNLNLDGLLFPSAQHASDDGDESGCNVILFNKASTVLFADASNSNRTKTYLYEHDEDTPEGRLEPTMRVRVRKDEPEWSWARWGDGQPNPALRLNLDKISILEIKGVRYDSWSHPVKHVEDNSPQPPTSNEDNFF